MQGITIKTTTGYALRWQHGGGQADPAAASTDCWRAVAGRRPERTRSCARLLTRSYNKELRTLPQALFQAIPIIIKLLFLPISQLRDKPQSLCHTSTLTYPFEFRELMNYSTACEKQSHIAAI